MKTYRISAIKRKAERIPDGHLYLEDCIALSSEWREADDRAIYTDEAVREIKDTWERTQGPPEQGLPERGGCKGCRGLG